MYNRTVDSLKIQDALIATDEEMACETSHGAAGEEFDKYFPLCDALGKENGKYQATLARYRGYEHDAAFRAVAPVPLAWGFAYLVLFLVRWVKRGFQS